MVDVRTWGRSIGFISLILAFTGPALAAPDRFTKNPLDRAVSPATPALTDRAQAALRANLDNLDREAATQLQAGRPDEAFAQWNLTLQQRRLLGPTEETKALAQVGTIAWDRSNTIQVRWITERLQQIQAVPSNRLNPTLLTELATAYQVIRAPELALSTYRDLLKDARQSNDRLATFKTLNAIGQTHLQWFGYPRAAKIYEDLLTEAQTNNDRDNQLAYLYQLAYIHERSAQPQKAATALQPLVVLYAESLSTSNQTNQKPASQTAGQTSQPNILAHLQIRLADNYAASQQIAPAEAAYQQAFKTAQAQFQIGYAGDALRHLGKFYRSQQRLDAAIQVYDFLATFEQDDTLNLYNAMNAYDELGQTYLLKQDKIKANAAFQLGLRLAQSLNWRIDYFTQQIAKVN
jgi:tetratricopeptide (TPR) repeat protein